MVYTLLPRRTLFQNIHWKKVVNSTNLHKLSHSREYGWHKIIDYWYPGYPHVWQSAANSLTGYICHWRKFITKNFEARSWWRHQMETVSALLALCAGNSPVTGEFPSQRPVKRSFDVFFHLSLNKRLSKQSRRWWFETIWRSLWRHSNVIHTKTRCTSSV